MRPRGHSDRHFRREHLSVCAFRALWGDSKYFTHRLSVLILAAKIQNIFQFLIIFYISLSFRTIIIVLLLPTLC